MTKFILIRHCKAYGQEPDAQLTTEGFQQAHDLVQFLQPYNIGKIISSPFTRTIQTITPYALNKNIQIEIDERLQERVLSNKNIPDWYDKLQQTFQQKDLKFTGGESSNEATRRILALVKELQKSDFEYLALVTHGNLSALLLNHISQNFGFKDWQKLSNPDVYLVESNLDAFSCRRIWK